MIDIRNRRNPVLAKLVFDAEWADRKVREAERKLAKLRAAANRRQAELDTYRKTGAVPARHSVMDIVKRWQ